MPNPSEGRDGEPPRTVRDMLARGRDFLVRKDRQAARLEAELLVAHVLGMGRLELFLALERPVEPAEVDRARGLFLRCGTGEPCAYITGKREFYGRDFQVEPGVLIPRPETELLVDLACEHVRRARAEREGERESEGEPEHGPRVSEFGTGSGCIAITLALELKGARVWASDVSPAALAIARRNAERLGARVEFLQGDGLDVLIRAGGADLLCANPPYIDPADGRGLDPLVRAFEPQEALFTPPGDPEFWVRSLIDERSRLVRPGGSLLVELGFDQAPRVRRLLAERELEGHFHADPEGILRILEVPLR
jgi:release factor glutamine methyltransferase